jgi:hypothetical protein
MCTPYARMPDVGISSYGYACEIHDVRGHLALGHTGLLEGYASMKLYFPDDDVSVILLGNQRTPHFGSIALQLASMVLDPSYAP